MSTSGREQPALQSLRHWSVRHASALKRFYDAFARLAPYLRRPLRWAGTRRMEHVLRPLERASKQLLFDCKMCGQWGDTGIFREDASGASDGEAPHDWLDDQQQDQRKERLRAQRVVQP